MLLKHRALYSSLSHPFGCEPLYAAPNSNPRYVLGNPIKIECLTILRVPKSLTNINASIHHRAKDGLDVPIELEAPSFSDIGAIPQGRPPHQ